ncbi:hypothetical protein B0H15DRAFT_957270 [Mycena belliarum]|uniref:Uncharacterized protein n=1 Tax=Mycena belliarum TaxID=1033014 RepID=A0AAD6XIK9_9AGAR|nr:hypothetical protein B0H15DRAFT_957270 [Mycena belliae]
MSFPSFPPASDSDVSDLYRALKTRIPAYQGFQYGFFYGTECQARRIVAVPWDYGITRLTSLDDLATDCWVPSAQGPNIQDMSIGRLMFDSFPLGLPFKLEYSYTIFYDSLQYLTPVNNCPPIRKSGTLWYGNILVVRHGLRKPVINVDREDARLIDIIVTSLIATGVLVNVTTNTSN